MILDGLKRAELRLRLPPASAIRRRHAHPSPQCEGPASLYSVELGLSAVERAFPAHGRGDALMPPKVYLSLPKYDGDFRAMPAFLDGAAGVKWVNAHPRNPGSTSSPRCALSTCSAIRRRPRRWPSWTARCSPPGAPAPRAASPPSTWRRSKPRTLGLVGCGVQARVFIDAHRALFGEPGAAARRTVSRRRAQALQKEKGGRVVSLQEASGADIVCTVHARARARGQARVGPAPAPTSTPWARTPPASRSWIRASSLDGRIFIDDAEQALHSGEVNVPLHDGLLKVEQIAGTLGEVVCWQEAGPHRRRDHHLRLHGARGAGPVPGQGALRRRPRQGRGPDVGSRGQLTSVHTGISVPRL